MIHLVYRPKEGIADYILMALGWNLIALYFMLSGFTFSAGKRTVKENYLNRLKHLLLPAVVTEIVLLSFGGIYCVFVHGYNLNDWLHDVMVTALRPEFCRNISADWGNGSLLFDDLSPSWFIWTMAWTELLFFPLAEFCIGKPASRWWITMAVLTGVQIVLYIFVSPVSWELQLVPLFTIFMLIGAKVREKKNKA